MRKEIFSIAVVSCITVLALSGCARKKEAVAPQAVPTAYAQPAYQQQAPAPVPAKTYEYVKK